MRRKAFHARRRAGRRQALRDLPEGQLAAGQQAGPANCAPKATRLLAAGTDPRAASRAFAQAVVADANDADAWLGLARALLAIKPDQGSERYDLPVNASGAA